MTESGVRNGFVFWVASELGYIIWGLESFFGIFFDSKRFRIILELKSCAKTTKKRFLKVNLNKFFIFDLFKI